MWFLGENLELDKEQFLIGVESILENEVKRSYPRYWDENTITLNILRAFETLLHNVNLVDISPQVLKIKWQAFKLGGNPHYTFGDVALLVNIRYQDKDAIEGVAFIEAKKKEPKHTIFKKMKMQQLRKISRHAPSATVLLYDYNDITDFAAMNLLPVSLQKINGLFWKPCTYAVSVPMKTVLVSKKNDTSLYKFSLPFSYQLLFRYFQSFDLDFRQRPIQIAKGFVASQFGAPKYLVVAALGFGEAEPTEEISFNRELFRTIIDKSDFRR